MQNTVDVHRVFAEYFTGFEALAYAVSAALGEGSICLDTGKYLAHMNLAELPAGDNPFWQDADHFKAQMKEGRFVTTDSTKVKPFVVWGERVYLHRYFHYETGIMDNIRRMGDKFRIITGGPGTGKTYGVAQELVKQYNENPDLKVAMAAPTGKAAARMNESIRKFAEDNKLNDEMLQKLTSQKAQTLHSLLGYQRNSVFFRHDKSNPLPYDVLVVDEASMIDGAMLAKLLDATNEGTRLFLIGDKDQLASVEAGSVFGDLCRAGESELLKGKVEVKLKNWRAKDYPHIIAFSEKIIAADSGFIQNHTNNNQVVIDTEYSETLFEEQASLYLEYIKEVTIEKALKALDKVRFLCVTREHDHSVAVTNKKIEVFLKKKIDNPDMFSPKAGGFYQNQPIIITRNDKELSVNNGDVGLIRKDPEMESDILYAWFPGIDGGVRKIQAGYLNYYDTVFAMTIHKSQGSDFDNVVVLLPEKRGGKLLTQELLYTGVTRAKKKVVVQSAAEVLKICIEASVSRASGLTQRLQPKDL